MSTFHRFSLLLAVGPALIVCGPFCGRARAQVLETETARLLRAGGWNLGGSFEYQTSSDGTEMAVPLQVEYGITDRIEMLLEPVPYTAIRPKGASSAVGLGDTEITLTYLLSGETSDLPAFAVAAETKLPTANKNLIGTGETDYTGYLIASKRFGGFDLSANLSFTVVGQPTGASLENTYGFALAGIYRPEPAYEFFAEILGQTSSGGGDTAGPTVVPEAASGEVVGTVGAGRFWSKSTLVYVGFSDDNNGAIQVRTGFSFSF